jgi:hypothetical protein
MRTRGGRKNEIIGLGPWQPFNFAICGGLEKNVNIVVLKSVVTVIMLIREK